MTATAGSSHPPLARGVTLPVLPYFVLTFAWTWSW